ncbi:hypothetical protein L9F63_024362, partial [Diploptera punctata]
MCVMFTTDVRLPSILQTDLDETLGLRGVMKITHTVILEDPFDDPEGLQVPDRSPEPTREMIMNARIAPDEELDETKGMSAAEIEEQEKAREARAQAAVLEIVGDIPGAEMAPPENVLFVCKLNPVTNDEDLEIIFSRFGKIKSCEIIKDKRTGASLQYAFIEYEDRKACEDAYFKMDNVLIDDRRIHVDFSQSVSTLRRKGKGRGVEHKPKGQMHERPAGHNSYSNENRKESDRHNRRGRETESQRRDRKNDRDRHSSRERDRDGRHRHSSRERDIDGRHRHSSRERDREGRSRYRSRHGSEDRRHRDSRSRHESDEARKYKEKQTSRRDSEEPRRNTDREEDQNKMKKEGKSSIPEEGKK